jgi:hypothetical protein
MFDDNSMGLLYGELVRQLREEETARRHRHRVHKAERPRARARAVRSWLASVPWRLAG